MLGTLGHSEGEFSVLTVGVDSADENLQFGVDESYTLHLDTKAGTLSAPSVFGVLRGLETFSQMFVDGQLCGLPATIHDFPRFPHRGVMLDTSRHYFPVSDILLTIDALSYNKMNVFHWHVVDSQSFPIESVSRPELNGKGAYSASEVYTTDDIHTIVSYATDRGVRVIPEFDMPGHAYSWGVGYPGVTVCGGHLPYTQCSAQPPCGQLDPSVDATYELVNDVISDMSQLFPDNMMHLGTDEVDFRCWNMSDQLREFKGDRPWEEVLEGFTNRTHEMVHKQDKVVVNWQEVVDLDLALHPSTVIQVWRDASILRKIIDRGLRVVISNYQRVYLDCGFTNYINGKDHMYCDPEKGWATLYGDFLDDVELSEEELKLVLGSEACMWTENTDSTNVHSKIWPRASALAERLWSAASVTSTALAGPRLVIHRERMLGRGVRAAPLQPTYCRLHPGACPSGEEG